MEQRAYLELTRMLEAFPQTSGNPDLTISAYELAVDGLPPQAVIEAAKRFIAGTVEGQSVDFAPAPPRFAQEARSRLELAKAKARPKLTSSFTHTSTPFHVRQEKTRTQYQDCPVLFENVNFDEFKALSKGGKIPVGGAWVAAIATVFGPPAAEIASRK